MNNIEELVAKCREIHFDTCADALEQQAREIAERDKNFHLVHDAFERLVVENAELRTRLTSKLAFDSVFADKYIDELRKKLAAAELDAARYRWLRWGQLSNEIYVTHFQFPRATWEEVKREELDAAIDAAMGEQSCES